MQISSHTRQKFLTPFTLRMAQLVFDMFRKYPLRYGTTENPPPFFVIGSGRSGTTLLRSFLFNHDKLDIPPETDASIPNSVKKFYRYGGADWQDLVSIILGEFSSVQTFKKWEVDLVPLQQDLRKLPKQERCLSNIIHSIYKEHITQHKPSATRWGDKSPFNTLRLEWIDQLFPQAQYINIIRDGRAVVSSYLQADLISDLDAAADRWIRSLSYAEKFEKNKSNDQFINIYYEDLVRNPEQVMTNVCSFLNITYSKSLLDRETENLGDQDMDHMKNVRKNVFTDSIDKWKSRLNNKQIERLNNKLSVLLRKHGYS